MFTKADILRSANVLNQYFPALAAAFSKDFMADFFV